MSRRYGLLSKNQYDSERYADADAGKGECIAEIERRVAVAGLDWHDFRTKHDMRRECATVGHCDSDSGRSVSACGVR